MINSPATGADGETRTLTAFATAPSRRRVYQFHHVGNPCAEIRAGKRELSDFPLVRAPFLRIYFGISLVFESASAAGLSGVGAGTLVTGAVAGAVDAGGAAITPFEVPLCA